MKRSLSIDLIPASNIPLLTELFVHVKINLEADSREEEQVSEIIRESKQRKRRADIGGGQFRRERGREKEVLKKGGKKAFVEKNIYLFV